jgi:hypothetical protein
VVKLGPVKDPAPQIMEAISPPGQTQRREYRVHECGAGAHRTHSRRRSNNVAERMRDRPPGDVIARDSHTSRGSRTVHATSSSVSADPIPTFIPTTTAESRHGRRLPPTAADRTDSAQSRELALAD